MGWGTDNRQTTKHRVCQMARAMETCKTGKGLRNMGDREQGRVAKGIKSF